MCANRFLNDSLFSFVIFDQLKGRIRKENQGEVEMKLRSLKITRKKIFLNGQNRKKMSRRKEKRWKERFKKMFIEQITQLKNVKGMRHSLGPNIPEVPLRIEMDKLQLEFRKNKKQKLYSLKGVFSRFEKITLKNLNQDGGDYDKIF